MKSIKISSIVPVYNIENYIENTIYSLINQSIFEDIEVILIDDGSTDNSGKIIEKYADKYHNIVAYHKENEGLTFTRNMGIDLAKGEYIHFMDGDDYIPQDAYEKMYELATKFNHDIVSGNFLRFDGSHVIREDISTFITENIPKTIESTDLGNCPILTWDSVVWNKIYKNSFLKKNKIKFPNENITYEDNIFSIEAYVQAESVGFIVKDVYFWQMHNNGSSLSTSNNRRSFEDRIRIINMINEYMVKNNCCDKLLEMKHFKWLYEDLKNMIFLIPEFGKGEQIEYIRKIKQILKLGLECQIDELNNYHRLLYNIVLNEDLNGLYEFMENFKSESLLRYGISDFKNDSEFIPLHPYVDYVGVDENCLSMDFKIYDSFDDNAEFNLSATLMSKDACHDMICNNHNIRIDLNSLKMGMSKINVNYESGNVQKENSLKIKYFKSFELDEFELDIGYGIDYELYIHKYLKNDGKAIINEISLKEDYLIFSGKSQNNIRNINLVCHASSDKLKYSMNPEDFSFKIHYMDLLKSPIRKWILEDEHESILINADDTYEFNINQMRILIQNNTNRMMIEVDNACSQHNDYMISVIVPVYNCGDYIRESLDSIVNQTLGIENIEVIIVDDSSTDDSVEIINQYVSRYPSIKLINQKPNKGSGHARNLGLKYVTSDYVTYLDADDYISLDAYEKALDIFRKDDEVDLVMYKWEEFDENGLLNYSDIAKTSLKEHKIVKDINDFPELIFATYAYIKIYSKRLFEFLEFPPLSYQDNIVSARVMTNVNKIYVSEDICAYYRQRSDSTSKEVSARNYLNLLIASKQVIDLRDNSDKRYYDVLSFLALKLTYWPIEYICKRQDFLISEGEIVYSNLKEYPKYFSRDILMKYQEHFPDYLPCDEECLWDIDEMEYHDYVIKHRYQKSINELNYQITGLKAQNKKLTQTNNALKKDISKEKKKNKELLNSRSWKLTAPLRRLKNRKRSKFDVLNKSPNHLTVAIKTPNPKSEHHWGDYFMALALKRAFEKKEFNAIIHEREDWYKNDDVDIVLVLRGLYEYEVDETQINLMWNISHPELVSSEEYEKYDIVFISSKKYADKINGEVKTTVLPLLQCSDPSVFYPEHDESCSHDILFVGIARDGREIMEDILKTDFPVSVYGKHWDERIDDSRYCGEFIPNEELHKYYSSCKILLNDHWKEMREWDFPSNRLFDALLSGAFVISDEIPSAKDIFKDCIVTYDGVGDLESKIKYYLENPSEREKIAKKGREIVLKNHTFDNRIDFILGALKNIK